MRILIADRQATTRSALSVLLTPEENVNIVGEAGDGQELLSMVKATRPDVVLLDWELPGSAAVDLWLNYGQRATAQGDCAQRSARSATGGAQRRSRWVCQQR